jgi:prevent-host-death family protein
MSRTKLQTWQLQTAKNRLSEVVEQARSKGPQVVTRHGREAAVVLGFDDYLALVGQRKPRRTFIACLLAAPKVRGGLAIKRSAETGRTVELE